MQRSDIFWIIVFALGFLFAFGVIGIPIGLGTFLFFNSLLASIWYFGQKNEKRQELDVTQVSDGLIKALSGAYVILSVPYLYRMDDLVLVALVVAHVALAALLSVLVALPGAVHIIDIFAFLITPLSFVGNWIMETVKSALDLFKGNANVVKLLLKFVLYAAVSLFIFILFSNLLSDADPEFKKRIQEILESLKLSEVMTRTVGGVIVSFIIAGLLTLVGYFSFIPMLGLNTEKVKEQWKKAFSFITVKRSDALFPLVITLPIFFLFALYVWVQTKYLFGQDMTQILAKYTFAEYVHRGFIELLVVGILSYPILAWTMNRMRTEWQIARIANFLTNTGIVSLLVVMLYSLFLRMNVYMTTYGPSVLRTYVLIGALFVGLVLLAYEIVAVLKVAKPGFSFMNSLAIGDYSVLALFTGLGLLATISLYSWPSYVVRELQSYYVRTKKVDVSQLLAISKEAQPLTFAFANTLEKDGIVDGAKIIQLQSLNERDNYQKAREESLFTRIFGFNFAGEQLLSFSDKNTDEFTKETTKYLKERVSNIERTFFQGVLSNDFALARSVFDPVMKRNDIEAFASGTSVSAKLYVDSGYEGDVSQFATGSRYVSRGREVTINRRSLLKTLKETTTSDTAYVSLTIGLRDGRLVAVSSNLILSYLPDAVVGADNIYNADVTSYGYEAFCEIPTLDNIYSPTVACGGNENRSEIGLSMPEKVHNMASFVKSDFVTEQK